MAASGETADVGPSGTKKFTVYTKSVSSITLRIGPPDTNLLRKRRGSGVGTVSITLHAIIAIGIVLCGATSSCPFTLTGAAHPAEQAADVHG